MLIVGLFAVIAAAPDVADAQVRTKKPDRGVYQSPRLSNGEPSNKRVQRSKPTSNGPGLSDLLREQKPTTQLEKPKPKPKSKRRELVDVPLDDLPKRREKRTEIKSAVKPRLQQIDHEDVVLVQPKHTRRSSEVADEEEIEVMPGPPQPPPDELDDEAFETVSWDEEVIIHDGTCDGCSDCAGGFASGGCDSIACDAMGCSSPWYRHWSNGGIRFDRNHWFGSMELLLLFRKGDRLPPLVTTTTDDPPNADTAGQIGEDGTVALVGGGDRVLDRMRVGGRFTLGTWLDRHQCRSLVARGWFAGEESFNFNTNQSQTAVIARPFLNVSDSQTPEQDTQLVAFPERSNGMISVGAKTDIYGADISVRQFTYGRFGGSIDFLYGYQFMRLDESLGIASSSTSLDDDFAPLGSVIQISDGFDVVNEFHGGQFGFASRYREGCWSFDGLLKFGFGSLQRRARLAGFTVTSIDGATATDPNGLLVRSTNAGTYKDDTFGWVPELTVSLGYQKYRCFDVTVGYFIVAMTDALQVSQTLDPTLAVNLSTPPTGQQRPGAQLQYETYYAQGIQFGLQYVY